MSFQVKLVAVVAALVGAAVLAILILTGGKGGEIETMLEAAAAAAARGDAEAVAALVSRSYRLGEEDYEGAVARIRREVIPGRFEAVELAGIDLSVSGEEAEARVRVKVEAPKYGPGLFSLRLKFRKEAEGWRVVSAEEGEIR
jgi:hypothetical protein